jgi:S1-C subfamily serine protease/HEAT repeat protein
MPIAITCPSCEARYKLADSMRGKKVICRECKKSIIVTSGGTAKRDEHNEAVQERRPFRDDDIAEAEEVEEVEEAAEAEEVEEAVEVDDKSAGRRTKRFRDDDDDEIEEAAEVGEAEESLPSRTQPKQVKKRGSPMLLIGGGLGVLAVAGVVAVWLMGGRDAQPPSGAPANAGTPLASSLPTSLPTVPATSPSNVPLAGPSTSPPAPATTPAAKETTPPSDRDKNKETEREKSKVEEKIAVAKPDKKEEKKKEIRVVARQTEQQIYDLLVKSTVWVKGETKDRLKFSVIWFDDKAGAMLPEIPPGLLGKKKKGKSPKSPGEEDPDDPSDEDDDGERKLPPGLTIISPKYSYSGSGSLISRKHRLILTNVHVAGDAEKLIFHFPDFDDKGRVIVDREHYDKKPGIKGELVERVDRADVALVKLESLPENIPEVPLARESARPGQRIHSLGSPGASSFLFNYTGGTVRGVVRDRWPVIVPVPGTDFARIMAFDCRIVETDATTNPGDSGGPAVDDWGRLVGIVQGGIPSAKKMNRCVDIREIHGIIKRYFKKIGEPWVPEAPEIVPAEIAAIPRLEEKVKPGNPLAERVKAIRALQRLEASAGDAFGSIFKLLDDPEASVRRAARDALKKIPPDKRDVALLSDALKNKALDMDVRLEAVKFLTVLGPAAKLAAGILAQQLKDADPELRKEMFVALLAIGPSPEHLPLLKEAWKASDAETRRLAGENLIKLGPKAKPALPVLIEALKSPDAATRLIAARAIHAIGADATEAKANLLAALEDSDRGVGVAAAQALIKLGDSKEVMPVLIDTVKTANGDLRKQACQGLASLGPKVESKAAVEELIVALDEVLVRQDASTAIVKIGKFSADIVATKMLKVLNKDSRRECIHILDRIKHIDQVVYAALDRLQNVDPIEGNKKLAKYVLKKLTGRKGFG